MQCCMELLRMLSDEANQICTTEKKQTIGPDHILKASALDPLHLPIMRRVLVWRIANQTHLVTIVF